VNPVLLPARFSKRTHPLRESQRIDQDQGSARVRRNPALHT
jgi:hypothetical protein